MENTNRYCVICGNNISSGNICSEKCSNIYKTFQKKLRFKENNSDWIEGFCNFCGKSHILKRGPNGRIWNRHPNCYYGNISKVFSDEYIKKRTEEEVEREKKRIERKKINKIKEQMNLEHEKERGKLSIECKREREKINIEREREREKIQFYNELQINEEKYLLLKNYFDETTNSIFCPCCFQPSIKYLNNCNKWFCFHCKKHVSFGSFFKENVISDNEKYKIYKLWGIEALSELTEESIEDTQSFVSKHFEKCCSSKGNSCLYFSYFKEIEESKHIKSIVHLFQKEMKNYNELFNEISQYPETIEKKKFYFNEEFQKQIDHKYTYFKETVGQIIEKFEEDCLIVKANEDLSKNQRIYVKELGEELVGSLEYTDGIEGFVWNNAKKGEMIGVFFVPVDFFNEINKSFINFQKEVLEEVICLSKLLPIEKEVLNIVFSKNGVFQNEIWKILNIDSRHCSRVVKSLLDKNLIFREEAASNGARTYLLFPANKKISIKKGLSKPSF